jgi:hypothetical protein
MCRSFAIEILASRERQRPELFLRSLTLPTRLVNHKIPTEHSNFKPERGRPRQRARNPLQARRCSLIMIGAGNAPRITAIKRDNYNRVYPLHAATLVAQPSLGAGNRDAL